MVDTDGADPEDILIRIVEEAEKVKLLVINGPNINFLGIREKGVYGTRNYQDLLDMIRKKGGDGERDHRLPEQP